MGVAKKCMPQYSWNTAKVGMKHQSIEEMMYICILAITKLLLMRWRCLFCTIKLVFKSHLGHMIYDCLRPLIFCHIFFYSLKNSLQGKDNNRQKLLVAGF
jgi:hypothetical protein